MNYNNKPPTLPSTKTLIPSPSLLPSKSTLNTTNSIITPKTTREWTWFHPIASNIIYYRPTYQYDTHLCKRVSVQSRNLVHELATMLGQEDEYLHSMLYPSKSISDKLKPRVRPDIINKMSLKERRKKVDLNINSYPRPMYEIGPKLTLRTPNEFGIRNKTQKISNIRGPPSKVSPSTTNRYHNAAITSTTNVYTKEIKQKYYLNKPPSKMKNKYKRNFKYYSSPRQPSKHTYKAKPAALPHVIHNRF